MKLYSSFALSMEKFLFLTSLMMISKSVKTDQFFKMIRDANQHNVILFDSMQRKGSLVECLLIGSRIQPVIIVAYENSAHLCQLYIKGDDGVDLPKNFDYYLKKKIKKVKKKFFMTSIFSKRKTTM